jgi:hypothetical protein
LAAYVDGVTPGTIDLSLALPTQAQLLQPAVGKANVDESSPFEWTGPQTVFIACARKGLNGPYVYVVTAAKQALLGEPNSTGALEAGVEHFWWVETHGDFANVDAATASAGFLSGYNLRGAPRTAGTFTKTAARRFTTAP